MKLRTVFVLISTRTKKRVLSMQLKGYMRTINPETLDYEVEEGILNCFDSMEQAMRVRKRLGKDKQVSVLGFIIPNNCMIPRVIDRELRGFTLTIKGYTDNNINYSNEARYLQGWLYPEKCLVSTYIVGNWINLL